MIVEFNRKYLDVNILRLLNNPLATVDNCFYQSGVSLVLDKCIEKLGKENICCCWIDFTSFATTMSYGNNFGFEALAINPKFISEKEFINNLNHYLSPCIKDFNSRLKNMYFHPQFMDGTNLAYVSTIRKGEDNYSDSGLKSEDNVTKVMRLGSNINDRYKEFSLYSGMTKIVQTFIDVSEQIESTQCDIVECADYMHQLYRCCFLSQKERLNFTSYYIGLPCIAPSHAIDDNLFTSQTAGFVFVVVVDEEEVNSILSEKAFYESIYSELTIISRNLPYVIALQLKNKAKCESIKSAKAAIMSRNMSHNLGSHVMAYLKQNLGSVIDIVKGNVIEKIISNNQLNSNIDLWDKYLSSETRLKELKGDENIYKNQIELPFLVGIGHFISYMQERQDYIATVSTDYVPYFSSINFKDDIYDVLNPDLRYLRHTDRIGGRPDNMLLSFIARSEGLQRPAYASVLAYEGANIKLDKQTEFEALKSCCIKERKNDIVLKFRDFDGLNDVQYIPVTISFEDETVEVSKRMYLENEDLKDQGIGRKDLDDMRSFNLSLPGGIAGRQAIFSIVENIIRNAAKHGAWKKRLDIVFDVFECSSRDIRFTNSKDGEDIFQLRRFLLDNDYFNKEDSRDLYVLTITDNIPIESRKVDQLKLAIKQKYVHDDCSMINENKGIKEIKISASWLRNLTHEEDEVGKAPILNVRSSNGHLQYIICVPKVKKYAIICSHPELYNGESLQSIYYYTEESFKAEKNKSFEVIAILDDSVGEEIYEKIKNRIIPISPNHIVRINNDDLDAIRTKLRSKQERKELPESLQQKIDDIYARMYGIDDCPEITIIDKKVESSTRKTYCNGKIVCLPGETVALPIFIYKTHLETEKYFYSFLNTRIFEEDGEVKKEGFNLKFAEGISGGNSTDRLIRGINCNFTSEWYYKHLNAMRKKVAIFDERLFSRMTNLTDNELVVVDQTIVGKIELAAQNTPNKNLNSEEIQELKKIGLEVDANDTYQQIYEFVFEDIKVLLSEKKYARSHLIAVNFYKNVHIYNIIYNNTTCSFDIYGYAGLEKVDDEIKFRIEKVGEISRIGNMIGVKFEDGGFDYLSIHQGLLDKIYHQWEIKDNTKCSVTQAFYEKIMKKEKTIDFDGYQYLPGFIIHSGRAKPSITDMPQKQPFIQYASIDHAVSDCKFTLVELLDNARYE